MDKYINYIKKLSWKNSKEMQENAIMFLSSANDWDYMGCIINTSKDIWGNLLIVIKNRNECDKILLLEDLLFLFKDLNWPGAWEAFEIIKNMKKELVKKDLEKALLQAYNEDDGMWITGLKLIIDYFHFDEQSFSSFNLNEVLKKVEWDWEA